MILGVAFLHLASPLHNQVKLITIFIFLPLFYGFVGLKTQKTEAENAKNSYTCFPYKLRLHGIRKNAGSSQGLTEMVDLY